MTDIEYLLRKYKKQYVKGEYISNKTARELMAENYQKERIRVAKTILASVNAPKNIEQEVLYWLEEIKDLQFINRDWVLEKIISLMVICEYQLSYPNFNVTELYLWDYYDFDWLSFEYAKTNYYKYILKHSKYIEVNKR